jgi:hypothetical protein
VGNVFQSHDIGIPTGFSTHDFTDHDDRESVQAAQDMINFVSGAKLWLQTGYDEVPYNS